LKEAEQVWREEGFEIMHDDRTSGVTHVFASERGFSLQATVNRNEGEGSVIGSGPCARRPANAEGS
jgi:hypothetical protein